MCGDGCCTPGAENACNCMQDCPPVCGNGNCDCGEDAGGCPQDCGCQAPGACGGQAPSGCYCDSYCPCANDCCPDACNQCGMCTCNE